MNLNDIVVTLENMGKAVGQTATEVGEKVKQNYDAFRRDTELQKQYAVLGRLVYEGADEEKVQAQIDLITDKRNEFNVED